MIDSGKAACFHHAAQAVLRVLMVLLLALPAAVLLLPAASRTADTAVAFGGGGGGGGGAGAISAWGLNDEGQCNVPAPDSGFIAITGGRGHTMGLKADGTIVAWGRSDMGQCTVPAPNSGFSAIAAGGFHSLGLKVDGTVVAWGLNTDGQCTVPGTNSGFVAVAGGMYHSLGLKADGTVVAWGNNHDGQCTVPGTNSGFVAISAGAYHSLGLKTDGSIVAWGRNLEGQCTVPGTNSGFSAVSGGFAFSMGLKADGTIVAWGSNGDGQCDVPAPNSGFSAIFAGLYHGVGLKADGTIVAWGYNGYGQCTVPAPNSGYIAITGGQFHSLGIKSASPVDPWESNDHGQDDVPAPNSGFKQVSGGVYFDLGLKADGTIAGWGENSSGQCTPAAPNSGYVRMSAGGYHGLGLRSDGSIAGWGTDFWGQATPPAPNTGYVAVDAGWTHSMGLKSDGTIVTWGSNTQGECTVPGTNSDFTAVAAGQQFSLGLKSDGTIVAWGYNAEGQCTVPAPNTDFTAISAGNYHAAGLKSDGTVVVWGLNSEGQCDVPAPNSGFKALAAGGYGFCLGLKDDGTIVGWGSNGMGMLNVPAPNSGFTAVAAGAYNSLAIRDEWPAPTISAIDPDYADQGQSLTDVDITGTYFRGPDANLSVELFLGAETIAATNVRYISPTTVRCDLDVPEDATTGGWGVRVTHADDGKTCSLPEGGGMEVGYPAPHVDGIAPNDCDQGDELESVAIIGEDFRNPPGGPVVGIRQGGNIINGLNVRWISPTRIEFDLTLTPLTPLGAWDVFVTHSDDGKTGTLPGAFTVNPPTEPASTWYLAEGCTAGGMETWVLVQNPNDADVTVDLTFMTSTGPVNGPQDYLIRAGSRHSFDLSEYVIDWDLSTRVESTGGGVVCERAMYGNERQWAHDSVGVNEPAPTWYLAEGCTEGGMETFVLVQNPGASGVTVDLTFMTSTGTVNGPQDFPVPAGSRHTFKANDYVTDWNVSTRVVSTGDVICERACYGGERTWAHDSIGSTSAAPTWYLAEGCTEGGMETWVLVQNPGATDVTVDLTFMTSSGPVPGPQDFEIKAGTRHSFDLSEYVTDWNVSTQVDSTGGDVICERAMYGNERQWAHDSVGVTDPALTWYLAEGCTEGGMETFVLVQNPGGAAVTVDLTFMTSTGPVDGPQGFAIEGGSRHTFRVNDYVTDWNVSTQVVSTGDVICERAMYGNDRTWAHDSIGYTP